jgi:hypothetical protein
MSEKLAYVLADAGAQLMCEIRLGEKKVFESYIGPRTIVGFMDYLHRYSAGDEEIFRGEVEELVRVMAVSQGVDVARVVDQLQLGGQWRRLLTGYV